MQSETNNFGAMVCYTGKNCVCSGSTYIKIGTIQRRLAWPLRKDDTQIREAFEILVYFFKFFITSCWTSDANI